MWNKPNSFRVAFECILSLNIACFTISVLNLQQGIVRIWSAHSEIFIKRILHLRQTDFVEGHIGNAFLSALLAVAIFLALELTSDTNTTKHVLRIESALAIVLMPSLFWIAYYIIRGWAFGWPYRWAPFELVFCIAIALLLSRRSRMCLGVAIVLATLHFSYWYCVPSSNPEMPGYLGLCAPILGLLSAVAWWFYSASLPERH